MGILDKAVGQAADVNQGAVGQTNVDKHAKVDDVQHSAAQFHPRRQILQPDNAPAENGRRQIFPRITPRPRQGRQHVPHRHRANR
jgi:hypothetical protein